MANARIEAVVGVKGWDWRVDAIVEIIGIGRVLAGDLRRINLKRKRMRKRKVRVKSGGCYLRKG